MDCIINCTFRGRVCFRTWEGFYIGSGNRGNWLIKTSCPDYTSSKYEWELIPSSHGGYWIKSAHNGLLWCVDRDTGLMYYSGNPGVHETFYPSAHPHGGLSWRAKAREGKAPGILCAEPNSHSVHLVANRGASDGWENFTVEFQTSPPSPAPNRNGPLPFECPNCRHQLGMCRGTFPGAPPCEFYRNESIRYHCSNCRSLGLNTDGYTLIIHHH